MSTASPTVEQKQNRMKGLNVFMKIKDKHDEKEEKKRGKEKLEGKGAKQRD